MLEDNAAVVPDFAFHEGKLRIRAANVEISICGGAEPEAHFRKGNDRWQPFSPEFRLVRPQENTLDARAIAHSSARIDPARPQLTDTEEKKRRAFQDFRASLVPGAAAAVERFLSHQFNLIDLISRVERVRDLAGNNPALAWCFANNNYFKRVWAATPAAYAGPVVGRKQREILEWLGFLGTEAMVHLMRKTLPEAVTPMDARFLRQAIKAESEVARMLAHVRVINAGILGLVCNLKLLPIITPQLLAEVSEAEEEKSNQGTADLLINAMYLIVRAHIRWQIPRFSAMRPVQEFHDRIVAEWVRREEEARHLLLAHARRAHRARPPEADQPKKKTIPKPREFPPPPIPGTDTIIPLTTKHELQMEAAEQCNCVASYANKVKGGGLYLYKVLSPERATLEITLRADGSWRRSELKGFNNRPVFQETRYEVDRWLSRFSLSV